LFLKAATAPAPMALDGARAAQLSFECSRPSPGAYRVEP
jgi:hypothetical protein